MKAPKKKKFAGQQNIPTIKDLDNGITPDDFGDPTHLNSNEQRKVAAATLKYRPDSI
jgi:hypothetical protein